MFFPCYFRDPQYCNGDRVYGYFACDNCNVDWQSSHVYFKGKNASFAVKFVIVCIRIIVVSAC